MTIDELISELTLDEKAALAGGADAWHTAAIERLGIPAIRVSDGPHGLRKPGGEVDIPTMNEAEQAVCFPSAAGLASSFNTEAFRLLGETLGEECRAADVDVILGPAINIKRSPLCGRNFEYVSEDPFLAGELATAYVQGVQSKNVGVSVKHFAANNQEKRRMTVSAVVDERTLREIYLSAFEKVVKQAKPDTLMCSYNKINGTYSSENPWLLKKVLRDEWGFDGFVMSDWGAVCNRAKGVEAGLDLEMPSSNGINQRKIVEAVNDGRLSTEFLDIAVKNILEKVDKYTHFIDKLNNKDVNEVIKPEFNYIEDHKTARRLARESMVLLKNKGMLPLGNQSSVLFVGEFAKKPRIQGGGSSHINCTRIISAYEASVRHGRVGYAKGFSASNDREDRQLFEEAVEAAAMYDNVVVFAGLPDSYESEGYDRTHMKLPECQNKLIRELARVNPKITVVLHNGSPVTMPWVDDVNAILEAYLGGEACGEAVVDLLFGVANPSGKLAETFPLSIEDTPCYNYFPGNQLTVEYREGIFVGYRYYDKVNKDVLFPFGHGLSYTEFKYENLCIEKKDRYAVVSFDIRNIGSRAGAEVAQVYVGNAGSGIVRPIRELKGFKKVYLAPGESRRVELVLDRHAFEYYNTTDNKWMLETGCYSVEIGASSRDIRLCGELDLVSVEHDAMPFSPNTLPTYFHGDPAAVSDEEFETLLGFKLPPAFRDASEKLTIDNTLEDAKDTKWGSKLFGIYKTIVKGKELISGPDMNTEGLKEFPIHSLMCMSGGMISEETAAAFVNILNDENTQESFKYLASLGGEAALNKAAKLTKKAIELAEIAGENASEFIKSKINK